MICKLCGKEFESGRAFHGHLIRWHPAEYKESGNDDKSFYAGAPPARRSAPKAGKKKEKPAGELPAGIRLLNRRIPEENEAYKAGYRYIDDEETVYTHEELHDEGVI